MMNCTEMFVLGSSQYPLLVLMVHCQTCLVRVLRWAGVFSERGLGEDVLGV